MKLYNAIQKRLEIVDQHALAKELGYNSYSTYAKTLDKFLLSKTLSVWLSNGHYDFVHTTNSFIRKLCEKLEIEPAFYQQEIKLAKEKNEELAKFANCYIFVNTNFRRSTEPIFVLAFMESRRNIQVDAKDLIFKDISEILEIVSKVVQEHYVYTKGILPVWGKIENYVYHHIDDKSYIFDTNGVIIDKDVEIAESRAILTIKNKEIM